MRNNKPSQRMFVSLTLTLLCMTFFMNNCNWDDSLYNAYTVGTPCAAGTYSNQTARTSACTNCSAGYYSTAGARSCTKCPSGYSSSAGASYCTKS